MVEVTIHHMKKGMVGEWRQPGPWCLHSGRERADVHLTVSFLPSPEDGAGWDLLHQLRLLLRRPHRCAQRRVA